VVLNPVRAGIVSDPGDWPWSSYPATIGAAGAPEWLATDGVLAAFAKRRPTARKHYASFVADGIGAESIWNNVNGQAFLGDDAFVARSLRHAKRGEDVNIPKAQRRPRPPSLSSIVRKYRDRDTAMVAAYATGGYSYQQIADYFGVHFTTVGRVVRAAKTGEE
jgi:hypothetical protein